MRRGYLALVLLLLVVSTAHVADAVTIYDIQYTTDPSGDSPYLGQIVTITGIVTAISYSGYVLAEAPGPWQAIFVFSRRDGPQIGDEIEITGRVIEYYGMTEISAVTSYTLLSTGNDIDSWIIDAVDSDEEMYESVLVNIADLTVTDRYSDGSWSAEDATGNIMCGRMSDYTYFPQLGDELDSVAGVLISGYPGFILEPRLTNDIAGELIPHFAIGGDLVTMNATLEILEDSYVEIQGDRIISISTDPPPEILVVETGGLIFPGLIDAHNHAYFNVLDHIPFGETFEHRDEWRASQTYSEFSDQFGDIRHHPSTDGQIRNLFRLAETRALSAGTTTIQGVNCNDSEDDYFAHQGMIINNAERFPSRIWHDTFPLSEGQSHWQGMQGQYWDRFVVHLSEGTNATALQEFYTWDSWGMLDWRTTLIHGVPLGPTEWAMMAAANANLVWSPTSNVVLYGFTPDVRDALDAGVNVALAPDWTPSGGRDMLAELKFANELNQTEWGGEIEPVQFALFATRNAARAMGAENRIGQVEVGFQANLMVIPGDPTDPYQALLEAEPRDVKLTVVSGGPMYGDASLIDQFPFLDMTEDVNVCGYPKKLAILIDAPGLDDSDKPISAVITELYEAYDQAYPRVCEFLGPFDCPIMTAPGSPVEIRQDMLVYPNPMPSRATISFSLSQAGATSLAIYDLRGGVIRTLVSGPVDAGNNTVIWDGRDSRGSRVAAGIYTVLIKSGERMQTGKIVAVK